MSSVCERVSSVSNVRRVRSVSTLREFSESTLREYALWIRSLSTLLEEMSSVSAPHRYTTRQVPARTRGHLCPLVLFLVAFLV